MFTKGERTDVYNYRPISLLNIPNKLLESQVSIIIDDYISSSPLRNSSQWGFSRGLSTEGMMVAITESKEIFLDEGLVVGAIYVDFREAFDMVANDILALKLQAIGFSDNLNTTQINVFK